MKTIAEEVAHTGTGDCCCCNNNCNNKSPCSIGGYHNYSAAATGDGTAPHGANQRVQQSSNKVSVTVSPSSNQAGDHLSNTCGGEGAATGVTATITTRKSRKKVDNNLNDNSRRQRYDL